MEGEAYDHDYPSSRPHHLPSSTNAGWERAVTKAPCHRFQQLLVQIDCDEGIKAFVIIISPHQMLLLDPEALLCIEVKL